MDLLRTLIRLIIVERADDTGQTHDVEDDLLLEPDTADSDSHNEASAISMGGGTMQSSGMIGGATGPAGKRSSSSSKKKKEKKGSVKPKDAYDIDWYKLSKN
tara:strand:- start:75 stop:380 length:306 start_codon:yes stop_codon:yes gene_type:complete